MGSLVLESTQHNLHDEDKIDINAKTVSQSKKAKL